MRELRRIDVLLNEETDERFNEGDMITIETNYGRKYTGRLVFIETCEFTLDMSEEYNSKRKVVNYDEIINIKKVSV